MTETRFCTRCVISNHRPVASREYDRAAGSEPERMAFDGEGVCAACRVAVQKDRTDWGDRERELVDLLARYRRSDGRPDVLVPGSGGKDSVYAAHLLKFRYSMHPLTVTWAPHAYTPVGWRNFQTWLAAGFDNFLVTPNPKIHRLLTRLAFLNLLHPFQPFVLGQRSLAPKIAKRFDIRLVFFGENDAEYEGTPGWQEQPEFTESSLFDFRLMADRLHISGVPVGQLVQDYGLTKADLWTYMPPFRDWMRPVETRALGHFIRWQPQAAYYFAAEHGFEANEERTEGTYSKYNSIDDRLDPLHYYTTWVKFGLGRASYDAAQEIRNGHLTREEGVSLVHRYDGEIRDDTVAWASGYMGITVDEFWATIKRFKRKYPVVA